MAKKKVQQIKDEQGYTKDAPRCDNCAHFTSDITYVTYKYSSGEWPIEKNVKCSFGGFACKRSYWCKAHQFKHD